ncbi:hypothetical protein RRG08_006513 [Elysia crispata]|uniref:HAT C-terminal dimerisation domain-containing protein n=1 Tax=Elysia crispata TaxID=231223 RepID=A0AAE0YBH1_9GAST|nr:hypothetical protein RRG08_006513 [Elysia crispata]
MSSTPPPKKRKVLQTFRVEYTQEWPCMLKSRIGPNHAFCTVCSADISIGHSGRFDITSHIASAKHKKRGECWKQMSISSMFVAKGASAEDGHTNKVTYAEALMVDFIAQHNPSLSLANSVPELIKSMCPDSSIAKDLKCARSKSTAMTKELSKVVKESLVDRMKKGPFTISTDGSNDMEKSKLFPIVVRTEVADKTLAPNASKKASKILETLRSRSTRLYIMFLSYTIKLFDSFLTVNQSDSPKAHKMQNSCRKLIRDILVRFVVPAAFGGGKSIEDVNYKSKYNLKHDKDLIIGEMSRVFIENKESNGLNEEKVKDFYKHVKLYFTTCTDYMIKNLPISDPFLKHLAVADPDMIPHSSSDRVRYFAQKFPVLTSETSLDTLLEEFSSLQCAHLPHTCEGKSADQFFLELWNLKTEDGGRPYKNIALFMLGLLTIPHSSAHCECVFSAVRKIKTDMRSSMGTATLEALLVLKHRQTDVISLKESALIDRLKKAYTLSLA